MISLRNSTTFIAHREPYKAPHLETVEFSLASLHDLPSLECHWYMGNYSSIFFYCGLSLFLLLFLFVGHTWWCSSLLWALYLGILQTVLRWPYGVLGTEPRSALCKVSCTITQTPDSFLLRSFRGLAMLDAGLCCHEGVLFHFPAKVKKLAGSLYWLIRHFWNKELPPLLRATHSSPGCWRMSPIPTSMIYVTEKNSSRSLSLSFLICEMGLSYDYR